MKTTITLLFLAVFTAFGQLPYSWTANTNPGWTSSNPGNNTLSWQGSISTVSTSGFNSGTGSWYRYNNNQSTTYTSPTMNFTGCSTSSYVTVTLNLEVNLETNFDFLYFQSSTNNGTTWSTLGTFTGGLGVISPSYTITSNTNRFRFLFTSDPTVNSYGNGANTFIYYADILGVSVICPVFLPVELISFQGTKKNYGNLLTWDVESEINCNFYTLERSVTGTEWEVIGTIPAENFSSYSFVDADFRKVINYYRLSQTDFDGATVVYNDNLVSIDNRSTELKIISITNILGQTVDEFTPGLIIITYEDGSSVKKLN